MSTELPIVNHNTDSFIDFKQNKKLSFLDSLNLQPMQLDCMEYI